MEMKRGIVIEDGKKVVVKKAIHNKYNLTGKHIRSNKLLFCLSLIVLMFAFGCKHEEKGQNPTPTPSNEITITVAGDSNLTVETSNTFKVLKNDTWGKIKEKVIKKITEKENFEIIKWRIKDGLGTAIEDTYKFEKDETVFAISKRKIVKYKVEHYQENAQDEEYTRVEKDTEEKTGEAGKNTDAKAKQYEGFAIEPFNQVTINQDGSTVVKIKYKRSIVSIIINLNGGETTATLKSGEGGNKLLEGKFGAEVTAGKLSKTNHIFSKWEPELPQTFPATSPTTVYTAMWTASSVEEVTHSIGNVSFKMKKIDAVTDAVIGNYRDYTNREHNVSLSTYYVGETEVTQELWQAVMGNNPSNFNELLKNPAEKVIWFDCVQFCNKLTEKVIKKEDCVYTINDKVVTADFSKKGFRLPTEAEWEYAAMGGSKNKYAGCDDEEKLVEYAWYQVNSGYKAHEVGTRKPNSYGLYDMSGNVWEWCWDWYSEDTPSGGQDPVGVVSGSRRVARGGSWFFTASACERSNRFHSIPSSVDERLGLRLVSRP